MRAAQPGRLRRAGRAHAHEHLEAIADGAVDVAIADPVDVAQHDAVHLQRLARADHDAAVGGLQPHHVKRRGGRDAEAAALADGEIGDAVVAAEHAAVEIDDVAGVHRVRTQAGDDVGVAPGRHEADVLAVVLVGDRETEAPRELARLGLGHVAERKAQIVELLLRGREQEIALVAIGVGRADQRARAVGAAARGDVMAGGERGAPSSRAVFRRSRNLTVRLHSMHGTGVSPSA